MNTRRLTATVLCLPLLAIAAATCGSPSPYWNGYAVDLYCRENARDCFGDIGGDCDDDFDCVDGECCKDGHCGGGMCTYRCDGDRDCPDEMLCEHGHCFFACGHDDDCSADQRCEHGHSICEYDK